MRKLIGLFALIAMAAQADDSYRTFTAEDGRTLKARIIQYDSAGGKVQIEREDRKKLTVPATAFSEKDQNYIKAWEAAQAFMSTAKFKLEIEQDEVKSTKKEHNIDIGEESSGGRRGGESGVVTVAIDKNTQYRYTLAVENKSGVALKNIMLEYRIYYEQEKPVNDEKANKGRAEDDPRPERHMAVSENKVKDGRARVKTIEPKESRVIATGSATLLKRSASRPWGDKIDLKSNLSGAWIRLTMKGADGEKLVREIASPANIPKKFPWDPPDEELIQDQPAAD